MGIQTAICDVREHNSLTTSSHVVDCNEIVWNQNTPGLWKRYKGLGPSGVPWIIIPSAWEVGSNTLQIFAIALADDSKLQFSLQWNSRSTHSLDTNHTVSKGTQSQSAWRPPRKKKYPDRSMAKWLELLDGQHVCTLQSVCVCVLTLHKSTLFSWNRPTAAASVFFCTFHKL